MDFGRNIAGVVKIGPFKGMTGQRIVIRHGELVQGNELMTDNLRTAKATLTYICKDGVQSYQPEFTYMGFQYISVTGMEVNEDNIEALELYSNVESIGSFFCSDERINQLQKKDSYLFKLYNFITLQNVLEEKKMLWIGNTL